MIGRLVQHRVEIPRMMISMLGSTGSWTFGVATTGMEPGASM